MTVFERVKQDEAKGDLASARNRLASHAATVHFDPSICEQIARICVRMHDPIQAGRWYFLSESADQEADPSTQKFLRACNNDPRQVFSQLPRGSLARPLAKHPPAVAARLRELGYIDPLSSPPPPPETWIDKLIVPLFLGGLGLILALVVIGFITVVRWLV